MGVIGLSLVGLAASCGFPRLPALAGGDGGGNGDGAASGGLSLELLAGDIGGPGNLDGAGAEARFNFPDGVAVDRAGNLYVADTGNSTIRKITAAGVVTTLAGAPGIQGSADGTGADARFASPAGVAVDSAGNLYVADGNTTLRKVTPAGVVTTLAGTAGMAGSACTASAGT
jgi:secreted PhoX family phosphatase